VAAAGRDCCERDADQKCEQAGVTGGGHPGRVAAIRASRNPSNERVADPPFEIRHPKIYRYGSGTMFTVVPYFAVVATIQSSTACWSTR
jgi:hypothetical protein